MFSDSFNNAFSLLKRNLPISLILFMLFAATTFSLNFYPHKLNIFWLIALGFVNMLLLACIAINSSDSSKLPRKGKKLLSKIFTLAICTNILMFLITKLFVLILLIPQLVFKVDTSLVTDIITLFIPLFVAIYMASLLENDFTDAIICFFKTLKKDFKFCLFCLLAISWLPAITLTPSYINQSAFGTSLLLPSIISTFSFFMIALCMVALMTRTYGYNISQAETENTDMSQTAPEPDKA